MSRLEVLRNALNGKLTGLDIRHNAYSPHHNLLQLGATDEATAVRVHLVELLASTNQELVLLGTLHLELGLMGCICLRLCLVRLLPAECRDLVARILEPSSEFLQPNNKNTCDPLLSWRRLGIMC